VKSLAGTSRRLSYDHGQWSLETSELVRLDRDLYRPERRRIEGMDAIFAHLRSKGEGALLTATERLVRVSDHDGCIYEAMDGEWIVAEPSIPPGRPSRSEQLSDEVAELRAEVVVLRAAYAGLASRLRKLERFMADVGAGRVSVPEGGPSSRKAAAAVSPDAASPLASVPLAAKMPGVLDPVIADAAPQVIDVRDAPTPSMSFGQTLEAGSPGAGSPGLGSPGAGAAAPAPAETANAADQAPNEPELPAVDLPNLTNVMVCIRQLIGDSATLELVREKYTLTAEQLDDLDSSMFVDDEGRDRVLALSNLRATIELGGQLLGVPKQAVEEQIKNGRAEDDLVLAMSEIFNNLSGVVNREGTNPHLKAEQLGKTPADRVPWLTRPRSTMILSTPSGGRLWLVAR
jgi:hypothetical protein